MLEQVAMTDQVYFYMFNRSTNDQPVFWNSSKVHLMSHQLYRWSATHWYIRLLRRMPDRKLNPQCRPWPETSFPNGGLLQTKRAPNKSCKCPKREQAGFTKQGWAWQVRLDAKAKSNQKNRNPSNKLLAVRTSTGASTQLPFDVWTTNRRCI